MLLCHLTDYWFNAIKMILSTLLTLTAFNMHTVNKFNECMMSDVSKVYMRKMFYYHKQMTSFYTPHQQWYGSISREQRIVCISWLTDELAYVTLLVINFYNVVTEKTILKRTEFKKKIELPYSSSLQEPGDCLCHRKQAHSLWSSMPANQRWYWSQQDTYMFSYTTDVYKYACI